jgi:hypothetical protein
VLVDVGDLDLRRAVGHGDLHGQEPDGPGARHEHAVAGLHAGLAARPDPDGERLHQRPDVVGQLVGQREGEVLVDDDVVREGAVDGGVAKKTTSGQRL